jgi:hypothetical protein
LPVSTDVTGDLRLAVTTTGAASSGGLTVFNPDYPRPIKSTYTYGIATSTKAVEIYPSMDANLSFTNSGTSPVSVTAKVTHWSPWETEEEAAAEFADEVEIEPTTEEEESFLNEQVEVSEIVPTEALINDCSDTPPPGEVSRCTEFMTESEYEAEVTSSGKETFGAYSVLTRAT